MSPRIARLFEPLLRFLFPGSGRRRRAKAVGALAHQHRTPSHAHGPTTRRTGTRPLRGEDNAVVRPYVVAHERREEARRRQARRRSLRLAVHGVDIGPRLVCGVEVTA